MLRLVNVFAFFFLQTGYLLAEMTNGKHFIETIQLQMYQTNCEYVSDTES